MSCSSLRAFNVSTTDPSVRAVRFQSPSCATACMKASETRTELFATIKAELTVHEIIEEEIFYPELKAHPKATDIVLEGYQEHHVVDVLMGELEALDVSDEMWGAKAKVMQENIEHHIEEEETEMFPKARQVFDRAELVDLGERMAAKHVGELRAAGLSEADVRTLRNFSSEVGMAFLTAHRLVSQRLGHGAGRLLAKHLAEMISTSAEIECDCPDCGGRPS